MTFCYIILLTHRSNQIKAHSADYCCAHVLALLADAAMRALTLRQVASSPPQRGHFGKAAESLASKPDSFLAFAWPANAGRRGILTRSAYKQTYSLRHRDAFAIESHGITQQPLSKMVATGAAPRRDLTWRLIHLFSGRSRSCCIARMRLVAARVDGRVKRAGPIHCRCS
jgi:hypothetical protein